MVPAQPGQAVRTEPLAGRDAPRVRELPPPAADTEPSPPDPPVAASRPSGGFAAAARRHWWTFAVVPVAAVVAFVVSGTATAVYRSESRVVIAPAASVTEESAKVDSLRALSDRTLLGTFAEIARGGDTVETAGERAALDAPERDRYRVRDAIAQESNVVEIVVEGPDPETAQRLGTAVATAAVERFEALYPIYDAELLQRASFDDVPVSPQPKRDAAIAALVAAGGLVLALSTIARRAAG